MYYDMNKYPVVEDRPVSNYRLRWLICLTVLTLCICSATFVFIVYHNHLFGLGLRCPKKSMIFRADSPNVEKVLWDYATVWSNKMKNEKSFTIFLDAHPENDPDKLLNDLSETFRPLSLRPCPVQCRKGFKKHRSWRSRRTTVQPFDKRRPLGGLPLGPVFEMDLGSEFRFRDDVQAEAEENLMEVMEKMANESFDQLITIYLSTSTPTVEMVSVTKPLN